MESQGGEHIAITRFDPRRLDGGQMSEYHAFSSELQAESNPEDPPVPLEVFALWELWAPNSVDLCQPPARLQAVFRPHKMAGGAGDCETGARLALSRGARSNRAGCSADAP